MVALFTLTVFLSAGLLFAIQPMIAKSLLPVFGGGSSVWTTCMLFYQTMLLLGYLYAHVLMTRFGRRSQLAIHCTLLLIAITAGVLYDTPVAPPNASTFPVPWLILQLTLVSGLPFFAISSAGPLIQGWFSKTGHKRAHDPYFLYAASNAGSMIGLIAYPLIMEPSFGLAAQRRYWLIGFAIFICLALYAASRTRNVIKETAKQAKRRQKTERRASEKSDAHARNRQLPSGPTDHYQRLGVGRDASDGEIKKAYRERAKKCHPDVSRSSQAINAFKVLKEAYDELSDSAKRQAYDLGLKTQDTNFYSSVNQEEHNQQIEKPINWKRRLYWIYLAFIPSSMLLGVTNYITTDVVSLPLLWVLPLMVYLVTMIIAFGTHAQRAVKDFTRPMVLAVLGAMILLMASEMNVESSMVMIILIELLLLASIGIVCHGRLSMDRPSASRLTEFYLLMSVGGALGGLFNGIVSPLVFSTNLEYPIALVLALSVLPWSKDLVGLDAKRVLKIKLTRRLLMPMLAIGYVVVFGLFGMSIANTLSRITVWSISPATIIKLLTVLGPVVLVYFTWRDGFGCALTFLLPMVAIQYNILTDTSTIYRERTFYGVHKVTQQVIYNEKLERDIPVHVIHHGTTIHGIQYLDPDLELKPLGYYHFDGPCGMIMDTVQAMRPEGTRVGIMGLGSGAIAAHGRSQDEIVFFEIDPEVKKIAEDTSLFTYLEKAEAAIEVRLGDARKLIEESEEMGEPKFDLLHADAFSSDSIPVHLVTEEAVNLYFDRLTDDGMVVLHISNRYLDLMPLVYELAIKTTPLAPFLAMESSEDIPEEDRAFHFPSVWVVLTRSPETGQKLLDAGMESYVIKDEHRIKVWTDDFSNIISLIKWK